jgi:hypothetical protein
MLTLTDGSRRFGKPEWFVAAPDASRNVANRAMAKQNPSRFRFFTPNGYDESILLSRIRSLRAPTSVGAAIKPTAALAEAGFWKSGKPIVETSLFPIGRVTGALIESSPDRWTIDVGSAKPIIVETDRISAIRRLNVFDRTTFARSTIHLGFQRVESFSPILGEGASASATIRWRDAEIGRTWLTLTIRRVENELSTKPPEGSVAVSSPEPMESIDPPVAVRIGDVELHDPRPIEPDSAVDWRRALKAGRPVRLRYALPSVIAGSNDRVVKFSLKGAEPISRADDVEISELMIERDGREEK